MYNKSITLSETKCSSNIGQVSNTFSDKKGPLTAIRISGSTLHEFTIYSLKIYVMNRIDRQLKGSTALTCRSTLAYCRTSTSLEVPLYSA